MEWTVDRPRHLVQGVRNTRTTSRNECIIIMRRPPWRTGMKFAGVDRVRTSPAFFYELVHVHRVIPGD